MLADLLGVEVVPGPPRYRSNPVGAGPIPFQHICEDFDFAFQPSIDERQVGKLACLAFMAEASTCCCLAHRAWATRSRVAPAGHCIEHRYRVCCIPSP